MKRWILSLSLGFALSTSMIWAQSIDPCSSAKGIASVPSKVLDAIYLAVELPNPQEASMKAIKIAERPGSKLRVAFVHTHNGRITGYAIVVASDPRCVVATMTLRIN